MRHRHHRHRERPTGIKLVILVLCIVVGYAGILLGVQLIGSRFEKNDSTEPVGSLEGRFPSESITLDDGDRTWTYRRRDLTNILLMGVDWTDVGEPRTSIQPGGQSDFLLLVTLDRENETISTLQIDRDSMTPVRVYGPFGDYAGEQTMQICLSHAYGDTDAENCENTVWAVSQMLGGIPIEAYASLDIKSIEILNEALGGVTVTLEDDFSALDPSMTPGTTLTLRGKQAEYFVRTRMGIGAGTNESRMKRQREFMQAAGEVLIQKMSEDLDYLDFLFDQLSGHLITNADQGWLIDKAYESWEYERLDSKNIPGSHRVGDDGFMEFWIEERALNGILTSMFFE